MNALESALHELEGHAWPGCSGKSSHSEKSGPSASRSCCALALRRWPASFHSTPMSLQSLQGNFFCSFADAYAVQLCLCLCCAGFRSTPVVTFRRLPVSGLLCAVLAD